MAGSDTRQISIRCVGCDTVEEHFDLESPLLQIGTQYRRLVSVSKLLCVKRLDAASKT